MDSISSAILATSLFLDSIGGHGLHIDDAIRASEQIWSLLKGMTIGERQALQEALTHRVETETKRYPRPEVIELYRSWLEHLETGDRGGATGTGMAALVHALLDLSLFLSTASPIDDQISPATVRFAREQLVRNLQATTPAERAALRTAVSSAIAAEDQDHDVRDYYATWMSRVGLAA